MKIFLKRFLKNLDIARKGARIAFQIFLKMLSFFETCATA